MCIRDRAYQPSSEEPVFSTFTPSAQTGTRYTPKWLFPKCGARFGFGGKLVTFQGKCLKVVTQLRHSTEKDLARRVTELDQDITHASQNGTMAQLYDRAAREALTSGEKLELVALKSLSTGSQDDLFKEFGIEPKKVTFEAERFLGKQI